MNLKHYLYTSMVVRPVQNNLLTLRLYHHNRFLTNPQCRSCIEHEDMQALFTHLHQARGSWESGKYGTSAVDLYIKKKHVYYSTEPSSKMLYEAKTF